MNTLLPQMRELRSDNTDTAVLFSNFRMNGIHLTELDIFEEFCAVAEILGG
jgi:hypothetical protein